MKKIILIIITLFLTTGCFNYLSLNDIAVVSLVHIDYQDNKYILTVEIRENEKDNPNASSIYTNQGITLDNSFENIGLTINKFLYLVDVDTIILTENVLNQKLETTLDYITRENYIGNNFNIIVSNDDIKEITKLIKENGLPLPIFVRGDDIEFSMRNNKEIVSLNGINVWHDPFILKYNEIMEDYYLPRNMIMNALLSYQRYYNLIKLFSLKKCARNAKLKKQIQ